MNDHYNRLIKSAVPSRHFNDNLEETPVEILPIRIQHHPITQETNITELSIKTNTKLHKRKLFTSKEQSVSKRNETLGNFLTNFEELTYTPNKYTDKKHPLTKFTPRKKYMLKRLLQQKNALENKTHLFFQEKTRYNF